MLEEIAQDDLTRIAASNQQMFSTDVDYGAILSQKAQALQEWQKLESHKREAYRNLGAFEAEQGIPDLKDPDLVPAKNMYLVLKEIQKRVDREDPLRPLGIEPLDFDDATLELAESIENDIEIRELYKIRKAATGASSNAGISADEAGKIKNCFSQGRELFVAGRNGSLMVKPLNFFYALTAYTYGVIVLNNPLRYRKDMLPGSHGMTYLPTSMQAQFGGDLPRGTFSDLVGAFPTHLVTRSGISFNVDCSKSLMEFYNTRFNVSLGTLLSLIPEMSDYYRLTTGRLSRCFPLEIVGSSDPRRLAWEFQIGNGETRPPPEAITNAFGEFSVSERYGKTVVSVPAAQSSKIKATIYTDLRGSLWFVENPFFPIIMPEIAIHFLITNIFSNIMRYRPDEWGGILLNEVSSDISLLTRHYFSSFQRKFMLLVLRSVSRYIPYAM